MRTTSRAGRPSVGAFPARTNPCKSVANGSDALEEARHGKQDLTDDALDRATIERCRGLLADEADDLSDSEVDSGGRHAEALARVIVEMFLAQRAGAE